MLNSVENLRKLINIKYRRLQKLKEQQALHGVNVDPGILIEIEDTEAEIADLQVELTEIENKQINTPEPPGNIAITEAGWDKIDQASTTEKYTDWDIFVCHAWEDKDSFARPLAKALAAKGLSVWFDESTLTVGDSLRRSIDEGLAKSKYGIVILSPNFFAKEWPKKELDGLASREVSGDKVILPVWHNITADQIRKYSPTLADRVAVTSNRGLENVVTELLRVIKKPDSERLIPEPTVAPPLLKRLLKRLKWWEIVSFIVAVLSCIAAWLALPQIQNLLAGSNTPGIIPSATLTLMPPDTATTPVLPTQSPLITPPTVTHTPTETIPLMTPLSTPKIVATATANVSQQISIAQQFSAPGRKIEGITSDGTHLWLSDNSGTIFKIDTSGKILGNFASPDVTPQGITWDGSSFWVFTTNHFSIYQFEIIGQDAKTISSFRSPASVVGGGLSQDMAWDGEGLWYANQFNVYKLDSSGNILSSFTAPKNVTGLDWDGSYLWLAYEDFPNTILTMANTSGESIATFPSPISEIMGLAWVNEYLWAIGQDSIYKLDVTVAKDTVAP